MGLPWVRLDSNIGSHPKILQLVDSSGSAPWHAAASYVTALGWAGGNATRGKVPKSALPMVHGTTATAALLVGVGLWTPIRDGWDIYTPDPTPAGPGPIPVPWVRCGLAWVPNPDYAAWFKVRGRRIPPPVRPAIPRAVRDAVLARDGYVCAHCGAPDRLTMDHVIPYSHGGPDTVANLRTLCRPCNSRRGNRVTDGA